MNPILALILANVIWGAASPIFKFALLNIPPFTLALIRFGIAAILFLPFMRVPHHTHIERSDLIRLLLGSFFGITLHISLFFFGIQRTDSINAPIIFSSAPLFLFLASLIFLREKPKLKVLGGMMLSFVGILVIILAPLLRGEAMLGTIAFTGNLLLVLSACADLIATLILKPVLQRIDPYRATCIIFSIAAATYLPLAYLEWQTWSFAQLNTAGLTGILFGVFFSSALGYLLFYYGLSKIAAQEVGIFSYIDPVIAVVLAIPLLGEYPDRYFFVGCVLIFGGIYLAEKRLHYHPIHRLKVSR